MFKKIFVEEEVKTFTPDKDSKNILLGEVCEHGPINKPVFIPRSEIGNYYANYGKENK